MTDKVYGPDFRVEFDNFPCPTAAQSWDCLDDAKMAYEDFLLECSNNGQEPGSAWIYIGTPDGDEEHFGYPDYPDYILEPEEDKLTARIVNT